MLLLQFQDQQAKLKLILQKVVKAYTDLAAEWTLEAQKQAWQAILFEQVQKCSKQPQPDPTNVALRHDHTYLVSVTHCPFFMTRWLCEHLP